MRAIAIVAATFALSLIVVAMLAAWCWERFDWQAALIVMVAGSVVVGLLMSHMAGF